MITLDISSAIKIPMNHECIYIYIRICSGDAWTIQSELLNKNHIHNFDAIRAGLRTATSRKEKYKNQLILFIKKQ